MGRGNGPAADYDLLTFDREYLTAAFGFNSHCLLAFKQDAPSRHAAADIEVQSVSGHIQVIQGIAHAHAIDGIPGPGRDAGGLRMVHVLVDFVPHSNTGILKGPGIGQPLAARVAPHRHRTLGPVEIPSEIQVSLQLVEVGQDLGEGPFVIAHCRPAVVVLWDATEEHLSVDSA